MQIVQQRGMPNCSSLPDSRSTESGQNLRPAGRTSICLQFLVEFPSHFRAADAMQFCRFLTKRFTTEASQSGLTTVRKRTEICETGQITATGRIGVSE